MSLQKYVIGDAQFDGPAYWYNNTLTGTWNTVTGTVGTWPQTSNGNTFPCVCTHVPNVGWVAVDGSSTSVDFSADGITWSQNTSNTSSTTGRCIAASPGGNILYITANGNYCTSTNGISWTHQGSGVSCLAVRWLNGYFFTVDLSNKLRTSTNGIVWTSTSTNLSTASMNYAYGNGAYVTIDYATGNIYSSSDGITWTFRYQDNNVDGMGDPGYGADVVFGNGIFVATGFLASFFGDYCGIYYSSDGISWNKSSENPLNDINDFGCNVIWDGTQFVMCGVGTGRIITSVDGNSWTLVNTISAVNTGIIFTTNPQIVGSFPTFLY